MHKMNLFVLLNSLPPEIAGSAVLSKVGLVDLVRLESALPTTKFREFLYACYRTVDPVPLPENLSAKAQEGLQWLFKRKLKVCKLVIDDDTEKLVPLIADNTQLVSEGIKLRCTRPEWDPCMYLEYPELTTKVTDVSCCPYQNSSQFELTALPFSKIQTLYWHSYRSKPNFCLLSTISKNPLIGKLTLHLSQRAGDDGLISTICSRFATLIFLSLGTVGLTDQDLEKIGNRCKLLTTLELCMLVENGIAPRVTDAGVQSVTMGCERLESFLLHGQASLSSASITAAMTHCSHLVTVSMRDVAISDAAMQARSQHYAPLQKLCCRWDVTSSDHPVQHALSGLTELHITQGLSSDTADGFCQAICGMPLLSDLKIYSGYSDNSYIPACAMQAIADNCYQLTKVQISMPIDGNATEAVAALVRGKSRLIELGLTGAVNPITAEKVVIELTENCPKIQSLTLSTATALTDALIVHLVQRCPVLRDLNLRNCTELTNESILALAAHCPGLRTINVACSIKIREPAVEQLVQSCAKLDNLTLSMSSISEKTAELLMRERGRGLFIDRVGWCDTFVWRGWGGTADY